MLDYNQGRLPFAVAQVGNAFRNEIAPKSGLLRVREFTMAEIEHFFDPSDNTHAKFQDVKDTEMILYSAENQMRNESVVKTTIGKAVEKVQSYFLFLSYFKLTKNVFNEGIDCERDLRIFFGKNSAVLDFSRNFAKLFTLSTTHGKRNGSLCRRLLGC